MSELGDPFIKMTVSDHDQHLLMKWSLTSTAISTFLTTMKFPTIPTWLTIAFLWIFPIGGVGLAAW
jgi:hypothetical protein